MIDSMGIEGVFLGLVMLLKGLKCERKSRCTEIKEIKICDTFAETCLFSIYDTLHVYDSAWSSRLGQEKQDYLPGMLTRMRLTEDSAAVMSCR